jgi:hypothetical protein
MAIQQDNPRYANPTAGADMDASRDSTKDNPLSTGKKDVSESSIQEWGSLRKGVPKADPAFGLPPQQNPRADYDPNNADKDAGGGVEASQEYVQFPKGRDRPGNAVVAKPL